MSRASRLISAVLSISLLSAFGCGLEPPSAKPDVAQNQINDSHPQTTESLKQKEIAAASETNTSQRDPLDAIDEPEDEPLIKSSFFKPDSPFAESAKMGGLSEQAAVEQIGDGIRESLDLGPTLVVWLFDQSKSAFELVTSTQSAATILYQELSKTDTNAARDDRLLTAVVAFGTEVEFLLDEPSGDAQHVIDAFNAYRPDPSGKEMTFTAIKAALDKYAHYRTQQRREVMFVVVTDEAGDDPQFVDQLVDDVKKFVIPVYTIGVPAPFGLEAAVKPTPQDPSIRQGPESRHSERIRLAFWGESYGLDLMDSGFGPFELERLCRASGGSYLALRPESGGSGFVSAFDARWPSPAVYRFDSQVMRRYAPDYVADEQYQAMLNSNKACQALLRAAQLGRSDVLEYPQVDFVVTNEAELARTLTRAQTLAAKLEPELNQLYETLKEGETDRARLTSPRWKAAYDLAMGRAAAAKARVEAYNSMLAALKRGKSFENPQSNRWVLEPTDVTEDVGSAVKRLGEEAMMYLNRVVEEHPGTPWAKIADRELRNQIGWKWTERGS